MGVITDMEKFVKEFELNPTERQTKGTHVIALSQEYFVDFFFA